ncbi:MAG: DUF2520 domain-containing protein [Actinobacteria bacterium]|nr:DUF2520 domain-containing protein [Actinomycetota bacterium]
MTGIHRLPTGTIAIVGPGRVGTVLAAGLERAGHVVDAAVGRSEASLERFARRFPAATVHTDVAVVRGVDLVVIAVPDDELEAVATRLAAEDAVSEGQHVVHVAGSQGLEVLRRAALAGARVAACHPAQTLPSTDAPPSVLEGAAWAVTARADDQVWARSLVEQLGGVPHDVPEDRRILYHAGLTVGSNAVGAAVSVARRLLLAASVDDPGAFLGPLVASSVGNVLSAGAAAITGPVVRGDVGTVRRHLEDLDGSAPDLAAVYRDLGRVILAQVRPGLPPGPADELETLFGGT